MHARRARLHPTLTAHPARSAGAQPVPTAGARTARSGGRTQASTRRSRRELERHDGDPVRVLRPRTTSLVPAPYSALRTALRGPKVRLSCTRRALPAAARALSDAPHGVSSPHYSIPHHTALASPCSSAERAASASRRRWPRRRGAAELWRRRPCRRRCSQSCWSGSTGRRSMHPGHAAAVAIVNVAAWRRGSCRRGDEVASALCD